MSRTTNRWRAKMRRGSHGHPETLPERRYPITPPALPATLRLKTLILDEDLVVEGDITTSPDDPGSAPSDGLPPTASPTPTVTGGPRWLAVKWTAQPNVDPVTYDVHVGTAASFTISDTTLAVSTPANLAFIRTVNGVPLAYESAPGVKQDYYVKLVARDIDGSAPTGGEVGPSNLDPNATDDILAGSVTAEKLESVLSLTSALVAGTLGAQRIEVGYGTDSLGALDPGFIGIRSYTADGTTTTFRVDAITGEVYVKGRLDFGAGSRLLAEDIIEIGPQSVIISGFMTPQLIQSTHKVTSSGGGSTLNITWPSPTSTGNLCILTIDMYDEDGTAPADPAPTGWTLEASKSSGGAELKTYFYRSTTGASRSGTETITLGDTVNAAVQIAEYSGLEIASADKTATATGIFSDPNMVTGTTATTTQAAELWLGLLTFYGNDIETPETFSVGTNGFTVVRQTVNPYSEFFGSTDLHTSTLLSKVVTATGAASTGHTNVNNVSAWNGIICTFKAKAITQTVATPDTDKIRVYNKQDRFGIPMLTTMDDTGAERAVRPFQDVEKRIQYINELCGGINLGAGATNGVDGMLFAATSGTGSALADGGASAGHPGVWDMITGTTTSGYATMGAMRGVTTNPLNTATGDVCRMSFSLQTPGTTSNGTNRYRLGVGLMSGNDPNSVTLQGVWVVYCDASPAIGGGGSVNNNGWTLFHGDGTDLAADPLDSAAVNTSTWYRIDIEHVVGTGTSVWINGILVKSNFTTNLFAAGVNLSVKTGLWKYLGTTSRTTSIDMFAFEYIMASSR